MQPSSAPSDKGQNADVAEKALAALHRSVPSSRMRDYGMCDEDVARLAALAVDGRTWDRDCEEIADRQIAVAEELISGGNRCRAGQHLEWAGAALNIGQLAFNYDDERKRGLLDRSNALYRRAGELSGASYERTVLNDRAGHPLYGWEFPVAQPSGCVLIVGGLSGWGSAYFSMARALNARGLAAYIVEGPGQGETRVKSPLFLSRATLPSFEPLVGRAAEFGGGSVGIMGNSFGGLIAAHVASADNRIHACCINGAPPKLAVPDFRTAREQMEAAFGVEGEPLAHLVEDFGFESAATPLRQPVLIVQGGSDPLVPTGGQAAFAEHAANHATLTWEDGQHTIYNHAADRNAMVSAWFKDQLQNNRRDDD